jgi:hypothetical protein
MSSISEDSRTEVFICNVTNANAALSALPSQSGAFYVEPSTARSESAIANTTPVRFAYRNTKGILSFTVPMLLAEIKNAQSAVTSPRVEQVSYLGYNGTSGSMDATASTYYGLKIVLNNTFGRLNNSPIILTVPYKSDSSATQKEVAAGLAIAATDTLKRYESCITVERINAGAQADAIHDHTCGVVKGGKQITFSADSSAFVTVGTILRFGTTGAGVTPCYVVASVISTTVFVLDQAYQGATATIAEGSVESVTEGNWGIKFTGVSTTDANFNPLLEQPDVVSFTLQAPDFTTATITNTTAPYIGTGTYQQVAALQAYAQFQNKDKVLSRFPQTVFNSDAIAGNTYGIYSWEVYKDGYVDTTTGGRPVSKVRYVIALLAALNVEEFHTVLGVATANP